MAGPNKVNIELIATQFNKMLGELAAIDTRVEFSEVILEVSRSVVQNAMSRTKSAKVKDIVDKTGFRMFQTLNGKKYFLLNKYPAELWAQIEAQRLEGFNRKKNARGLAKQSWWHLANMFDRPIVTPAYVVNANYKGRKYPGDVSASQRGSLSTYQLTIKNNSPLVGHANMPNALKWAMHGQTRNFETKLKLRAFKTVASRATAYPGIFVRPRN